MRSLPIVLILLLAPGYVCPQSDTRKQDSPLAIGIARNQQELQELSKLISENNAEMRHIAGDVYVSLAAAVAGAGPESEFGQSPREAVAKLLDALQKLEGAIDTSKDALDGDAWLAISGQLKLVLDVIGEEDVRIRFANTLTDLLINTAQLVALARQNADLVAVKVRIAEGQTYLLAKAASMQLRRTAGQASLLAQIKTFSDLQSRWLLEQYKDRPQVIQLAVKTASTKDASRATQIVKGLQAGDAANAMDLSNIPGINPDAVEAMRRCNAIALTMVCRFENVAAIRRTCPKAHNPGDDPPPCPAYERAAAQNAAIDRASMTCNKYSDGSYIPFFGPPRGVATMWPMAAPTSAVQSGCGQQLTTNADSPSTSARTTSPAIDVRFERQGGRTGITYQSQTGGWVLDPTEKYIYKNHYVGGGMFWDLDPGNYIFVPAEPGYHKLPIQVRTNYATVIRTAPQKLSWTSNHRYKETFTILARLARVRA
jgi:hypothetical protein